MQSNEIQQKHDLHYRTCEQTTKLNQIEYVRARSLPSAGSFNGIVTKMRNTHRQIEDAIQLTNVCQNIKRIQMKPNDVLIRRVCVVVGRVAAVVPFCKSLIKNEERKAEKKQHTHGRKEKQQVSKPNEAKFKVTVTIGIHYLQCISVVSFASLYSLHSAFHHGFICMHINILIFFRLVFVHFLFAYCFFPRHLFIFVCS